MNIGNKMKKGKKIWHFCSSEYPNSGKNWPLSYTTPWIWWERSKHEATNKYNKTNNPHQKVKKQTPPSTIPKTCRLVGTASLFPTGCTSCTGSALSTSAKFAETTATGAEGPSRCTSRSGGTPTAWNASKFPTPSTSKISPPSMTPSPFTKS